MIIRHKIFRNMQTCRGAKSCGDCLKIFPLLKKGPVDIPHWVWSDNGNRNIIFGLVDSCPEKALKLDDGTI